MPELVQRPWTRGPFELLCHAEEHRLRRSDFDRRMALISYDNAIEVSISTFLGLHPRQRDGLEYPTERKERWLANYHAQLDFLYDEFAPRSTVPIGATREDVIFYHGLRNELYHSGNGLVPEESSIQGARLAATWVFSVLFKVPLAELEEQLRPRRISRKAKVAITSRQVGTPAGAKMAQRESEKIRRLIADQERATIEGVLRDRSKRWVDGELVSGRTALLRSWSRLEALIRQRFPSGAALGVLRSWNMVRANLAGMPTHYDGIVVQTHAIRSALTHGAATNFADDELHELAKSVNEICDYLERHDK